MSNDKQPKVVKATYKSTKTSLRPNTYGKPENTGANKKADFTVQVHKHTSTIVRNFAHVSNNGTISFHQQTLTILTNSETNRQTLARRPLFVTTSLDPNEYTTKNGRINYGDSNTYIMSLFNHEKSSWNTLILNANIDSQYIPYCAENKEKPELVWDNVKHNQHTKILSGKLSLIDSMNLSNADKAKRYEQAWNEYKKAEEDLISQGILVLNNVLVAVPNGVVPGQTPTQTSKANNQYFSGVDLFSNENSKATYCPLINKVYMVVQLTSTEIDSESNWEYGMRTFNDKSSSSEENTEESYNGFKSYSVEAKPYNLFNKVTSMPIRIIVGDSMISRAERSVNFEDFCNNNSMASISNGKLELGFTAYGHLTSIFSITGDNLYYTGYTDNKTNDIVDITTNIDDVVDLPSEDMDIIEVSNVLVDDNMVDDTSSSTDDTQVILSEDF